MKIKQQLVKSSKLVTAGNNPGKYIAMHETDNTKPTATAQSHADLQTRGNDRDVSWHWQVDEVQAIQSFRNDQKCWHAGDGLKGRGLNESIAIEVCVNGDVAKAWENAARLAARLLEDKGVQASSTADILQHFNLSGKNCPSQLRAGKHGLSWQKFLSNVQKFMKDKEAPVAVPKMQSPVQGRVSSPYGARGNSQHWGLDIAAPVGTTVYPPFAVSTVVRIVRGRKPGQSSAGHPLPYRSPNGVVLRNPDGNHQWLGHVNPDPNLKVGQKVYFNTPLGKIDLSGITTGGHVHLEIWNNSSHLSHHDPMIDFNAFGVKPGSKPHLGGKGASPSKPAPSKPSKPATGGAGKGLSTADVKAIQRALAKMGYDVGPADGKYESRTEKAVKAYQTDLNTNAGAGLIRDGKWGPVLQKWFDWVKQLQRALPAYKGVPNLVVDGQYGPRTTNAVRTLQSRNGLYADGQAGPKTTAFMRKHGSKISNPPKNRP